MIICSWQNWNRLSRLQKSFVLMLLLIVVSFGLISTTFTWAPDASDDVFKNKFNSNVHVHSSLHRSNSRLSASTNKNEREEPRQQQNGHVANSNRLSTISKHLNPDEDATPLHPSIANQQQKLSDSEVYFKTKLTYYNQTRKMSDCRIV